MLRTDKGDNRREGLSGTWNGKAREEIWEGTTNTNGPLKIHMELTTVEVTIYTQVKEM